MDKTFFAFIAIPCLLLAIVLWAFGPAVPLPKPIGWGAIMLLGLWSSWPLLRHISRRIWTVLGFGVLAVALTACGTLGNQAAQLAPLVTALANAGCSGALNDSITATTAAGISPGAASVSHSFVGKCDPSTAPQVTAAQMQAMIDAAVAKVTPPPAPTK